MPSASSCCCCTGCIGLPMPRSSRLLIAAITARGSKSGLRISATSFSIVARSRSPRTRRAARFTTGVRARCSRTWWRRAASVCVRSRYAERRRWRAAFRSSRIARLSGPLALPAQPRFRMAKSPRRVLTWRSKRRASSVVGERASVRFAAPSTASYPPHERVSSPLRSESDRALCSAANAALCHYRP